MLAVFALSILGVLLGGAGIYRRLTQDSRERYNSRTCMQYFATKLRQAPGEAAVETFGDCQALTLREHIDGRDYVTRIYCHEGWLMELFTPAGGGYAPEDGEKILPLEELDMELDQGLLQLEALIDGQTHTLTLHIRTMEVGG